MPIQMAAVWLSEQFTQNPFVEAFVYKKVANKTRPVATTLPENFRITRRDHPDPLAGMLPLPTHPPDFVPTGWVTQECRDQMSIGDDLLYPEEVKLAEWILCNHDTAFAWVDSERGSFNPEYFAPIEISSPVLRAASLFGTFRIRFPLSSPSTSKKNSGLSLELWGRE